MEGETKQDQNEDAAVNLMEDVQTLILHLQTLELSSETTVLGREPPVDDVLKFQWVAVEESEHTLTRFSGISLIWWQKALICVQRPAQTAKRTR